MKKVMLTFNISLTDRLRRLTEALHDATGATWPPLPEPRLPRTMPWLTFEKGYAWRVSCHLDKSNLTPRQMALALRQLQNLEDRLRRLAAGRQRAAREAFHQQRHLFPGLPPISLVEVCDRLRQAEATAKQLLRQLQGSPPRFPTVTLPGGHLLTYCPRPGGRLQVRLNNQLLGPSLATVAHCFGPRALALALRHLHLWIRQIQKGAA